MGKITFAVMNRMGDEKFSFDTAVPAELTAAESKFREIMGLGYAAVGTNPETGEKHIYKAFDPKIEDTVFRPPLQGG